LASTFPFKRLLIAVNDEGFSCTFRNEMSSNLDERGLSSDSGANDPSEAKARPSIAPIQFGELAFDSFNLVVARKRALSMTLRTRTAIPIIEQASGGYVLEKLPVIQLRGQQGGGPGDGVSRIDRACSMVCDGTLMEKAKR
jgi:hypothetical protein